MTTPEQIIAKIEEIEKMLIENKIGPYTKEALMFSLLEFKQLVVDVFNLPTADPPEGSPGQEDMKG